MPFGNYTENIKHNGQVNYKDIDYFVWRLLLDIKNGASNPLLSGTNKTKIDRLKRTNLGDLNLSAGTEVLITFNFNSDSLLNTDFSQTLSSGAYKWNREYFIYITMLRSDLNRDSLQDIASAVINGLTQNSNTNGANYITQVPSSVSYGSDLRQNYLTAEPIFTAEGEDPNQPNYLTCILQVLFKIYKI
jgi:hypothetical protein